MSQCSSNPKLSGSVTAGNPPHIPKIRVFTSELPKGMTQDELENMLHASKLALARMLARQIRKEHEQNAG